MHLVSRLILAVWLAFGLPVCACTEVETPSGSSCCSTADEDKGTCECCRKADSCGKSKIHGKECRCDSPTLAKTADHIQLKFSHSDGMAAIFQPVATIDCVKERSGLEIYVRQWVPRPSLSLLRQHCALIV